MVHLDDVKYGRVSLLYWGKINFKSLAGDFCIAHLKLSLSQETKEKCQPWNDREIGGRERERQEREREARDQRKISTME